MKQTPGAIGYVELAYAKQNNMDWAQLKNKAGKYLDPSIEGAAAAADIANLPDNMEVVITDSPNPAAFPISGFTWLLAYENQTDAAKGDAIAQLFWWMTHEGQQYAMPLDYAPLAWREYQQWLLAEERLYRAAAMSSAASDGRTA